MASSVQGLRSGPVAGTAIVARVTFVQKSLQYAEVEGLALFEGDIVLGTVDEVRANADATAAGLIPYAVGWQDSSIVGQTRPFRMTWARRCLINSV